MSDPTTKRREDALAILERGSEIARELIEENDRLRKQLSASREGQGGPLDDSQDWHAIRKELLVRIAGLEEESRSYRERLLEVEEENRRFADRYLEIEQENNNLANLYVASYQLHSTLDVDEVLRIVVEIVINLIGAESLALYLLDGRDQNLRVVATEGVDPAAVPACRVGEGVIGQAVTSAETRCWDLDRPRDLEHPIVVIPLQIQRRPLGAIAIFSLLQQKEGFSALDHELFNLLGGHAATAIFAARLYSQSERKLSTIQGFLDLLAK